MIDVASVFIARPEDDLYWVNKLGRCKKITGEVARERGYSETKWSGGELVRLFRVGQSSTLMERNGSIYQVGYDRNNIYRIIRLDNRNYVYDRSGRLVGYRNLDRLYHPRKD